MLHVGEFSFSSYYTLLSGWFLGLLIGASKFSKNLLLRGTSWSVAFIIAIQDLIARLKGELIRSLTAEPSRTTTYTAVFLLLDHPLAYKVVDRGYATVCPLSKYQK